MRQSKQVGLLLVLFFLSFSQAGAWEFSMSGNFAWEYYQFSQLGDNRLLRAVQIRIATQWARYREARGSQWLAWSRGCQSPAVCLG